MQLVQKNQEKYLCDWIELAQKSKYKKNDKLVKRVNCEKGQKLTFLVFQENTSMLSAGEASYGRMVDCEYIKVNQPIKHSDYKETILKYCNVKYAPFDKDGNGNMGYLLDVEPIQDILK